MRCCERRLKRIKTRSVKRELPRGGLELGNTVGTAVVKILTFVEKETFRKCLAPQVKQTL
jgi:hypothetical protein